MNKQLVPLLASVIFFSGAFCFAGEQRLSFPMLGYLQGEYLYLPAFNWDHAQIQEVIYVYRGDKELQAALRKQNYFVRRIGQTSSNFPGSDIDGVTGAFVYEIKGNSDVFKSERILIFDQSRPVIRKDKNTFIDSKTNTEWKLVSLGSHEGLHLILQTFENGKCVRSIDYYFYIHYDTEAASEQELQNALCGERVNP